MSTSDQNQARPGEGVGDTGTAATPQAETPGAERGARHGRGRRGRTGGRHEQGGRPPQGQTPRRPDTGLNMDELRELTDLFSAHGLTDFEFENAEIRIRLSRNPAPTGAAAHAAVPTNAPAPTALHTAASFVAPPPGAQTAPAATESGAPPSAATTEAPEEELHVITSPIVGTFYRASSPQVDSFVKVGSQVENDTVVCIIEAMKLMNEIQAETTGTVAKIYVENGQPVEYGQPLFGVKR
ncbi:MAG: acetyl-CoA carboxylase biotin carboxyl carrier protein [Pyrinomonadaceae bacterium]